MAQAIDLTFDRIAQKYDGQRAHPPAVSAKLGEALSKVVQPGSRVLELGVGTGRIALPLAGEGCQVVGVDISPEMLRVAKGRGLPRLVQGDIVQLPFGSEAFDAVLAVHVLHLPPDWRVALGEALRMLRPGGVFVIGRDSRDPASAAERLRGKLRDVVIALLPNVMPPGAGAAIGRELAQIGATTEPEALAVEWETSTTPNAVIDGMATRNDPETWSLDDALLAEAVSRVRAWAEETWDDLDAPQPLMQRFFYTVSRVPAKVPAAVG